MIGVLFGIVYRDLEPVKKKIQSNIASGVYGRVAPAIAEQVIEAVGKGFLEIAKGTN